MLGPILIALAGSALVLLLLIGRPRPWPEALPSSQRLPPAVVLAPLAGAVPHLDAFLAALIHQDYPRFRIVLIIEQARETAGDSDEVATRVAALERSGLPPIMTVVRAAPASASSQKAANLLAGLEAAEGAEVIALVDADALPHRRWLKDLVAPLVAGGDGDLGNIADGVPEGGSDGGPLVATGFRWYVPGNQMAGLVRSVYSAAAMSLITDPERGFAWGGSLAIRRRDLDQLGIPGAWRTALSDDMAVTRAVRAAGGRIRFVPECVVPSFGTIGWRALGEFAVRQVVMLRWGDRRLWATILGVHALFAATQIGALLAAFVPGIWPGGAAARGAVVALLAAPTLLGVMRARARFGELAGRPLARIPGWDGRRRAHIALALVMPWFMLASLTAAAFRREVDWCGIRYRLSPGDGVAVVSGPGVTSARGARFPIGR